MAAGRKPLLTKKSVAAQFRFAELHLNKPPDVCNNVLWILSHVYAFTASNLSFGQYFSIHCTISLYCCLPTVLIFCGLPQLLISLCICIHYTLPIIKSMQSIHISKRKVLTFSLCLLPLIFLVQPLVTRL